MKDRKVALQIRCYEPWAETAKLMADVGFRYVAMVLDAPLLCNADWKQRLYEMRETLERYGLRCIQTHAPYYDLLISAEIRDEMMETALLRSIEATKLLGAQLCAVHPRSVIIPDRSRETSVDRERSLLENLVSFRPLVAECEAHNVLLGIENLMKYPSAFPYFYSWIAEDHATLIDCLDSEKAVGIWDFGHANLIETDHGERIRTLGSRIKGTHVHNNDGNEDSHLPPFLPPRDGYYVKRCVDWQRVLAALHETGYDGYLTLESVIPYEYPIEGYIRYLYDSVCALDDMYSTLHRAEF